MKLIYPNGARTVHHVNDNLRGTSLNGERPCSIELTRIELLEIVHSSEKAHLLNTILGEPPAILTEKKLEDFFKLFKNKLRE